MADAGSAATTASARDFHELAPDSILDAVESTGLVPRGGLLALNSYENRVYRIDLDDAPAIVAKFYRPERWSDETILEEHAFSLELAAEELPVVAPMAFNGATLLHFGGHRFAVYPSVGGRAPEPGDPAQLEELGRLLARLHSIGARRAYQHRRALTVEAFGDEALAALLRSELLPESLRPNFNAAAADLLEAVRDRFAAVGPVRRCRIHGDCHPGNILVDRERIRLLDLDDSVTGPAVQDLWMLLGADAEEVEHNRRHLLKGYAMFGDFDEAEFELVEALRALRMLHFSAWVAIRWTDPAFPRAFPYAGTTRYWEEQMVNLREQYERLVPPATEY